MNRLKVHPEASQDIDEIAAYLSARSLEAALRFYDAIIETFDFIEAYPRVGSRRVNRGSDPVETRSAGVVGFRNYLIFFEVHISDDVTVIRVLHAARNTDSLVGEAE